MINRDVGLYIKWDFKANAKTKLFNSSNSIIVSKLSKERRIIIFSKFMMELK